MTTTPTPPRPTLPPDAQLAAAYDAHPLLDPRLPSRHPALARLWVDTYHRMMRDATVFDRVVRGYAIPAGSRTSKAVDLAPYFHDADAYLNDLLRLVPDSLARYLAPLPATRGLSTIRDLLKATFEGPYARSRYEAQRKLYLAKLLFDIEHSRAVRDGPKHRARFEQIVRDVVLSDVTRENEVEVFGILDRGPDATLRLTMERQPRPGDRDLPLPVQVQARGRPCNRPARRRGVDPHRRIAARSPIRAWCRIFWERCSSSGIVPKPTPSSEGSSPRSGVR